MAAVIANQLTVRADGDKVGRPVAASTLIYQSTLTFVTATGYLDDDTGSGANEFGGVSIANTDNSGGSDGDVNCECWTTGDFDLTGSGFTQADVGKDIYAIDNYTIVTDPSTANAVHIGKCTEYQSTSVLTVRITGAVDLNKISQLQLGDDAPLLLGAGRDFGLEWSTDDASNHVGVLFLGDTSQALHITDKGAKDSDWALAADTHPTLYLHSNTTPITDYLKLGAHDGTTAEIDVVGGTTLALKIAGTAAASLTASALTLADAVNIAVNTGTGTKIATAVGQKLGFWNVTPVVQPAGGAQVAPAAYATGAFGLDSDAKMQALFDLVVAIRLALVNAGMIKGAA